jgi:U4/U6.U5 tri-snRNP-associated protein 2
MNVTERPSKRPRLSEEPQNNESVTSRDDMDGLSDEEEETTPIQEEVKASDLYLDTVREPFFRLAILTTPKINRAALDFDFEKLCSTSLSNINVYGCLVCGKYFQGRGRKSYAYAHSIHDDHHVFINLETTKAHVLPFHLFS